ncbi:Hsp20/alpha crystallin family protein [Oceanobacillus jeddahense]|uniref:Hsp20/alpha crystallin family protein n=1 Tax=Oceanobacillus jeddahense TaxID=1462527 RepID=A0ABY5JUN1_9BACI|nr:Hsp20/alpha crystallin family protein [Oceanobacillus jeddahense]UUI02274.1 Hsp20/alpha crystallin family protein [Oceanobacillus jeddahense]
MDSDKQDPRSDKKKVFPENWNIDFTPFQEFVDRMDNLFSRSFKSFQGQILNDFPAEIVEKENNIYVKAEVPGYRRQDIQIEIIGNRIKITLNKDETISLQTDKENVNKKSIQQKERIITLPFNIPKNSITATLENGILIITIPKQSISSHMVDIED